MHLLRVAHRIMCTILAVGLVASAPASAQVTVGTMQLGNSIPFGSTFFGNRYQQVYSASAFTGPLAIQSLSFFCTNSSCIPSLSFGTRTFSFSLSTTSKAVAGLSSSLNENFGSDVTPFYSGVLSGTVGAGFSIVGNMFNYDPSQGNLLLEILVGPGTLPSPTLFVDRDAVNSGLMSRAYGTGDVGTAENSQTVGLVTGFNVNTGNVVASVPEPATTALLGAGFALLAVSARARRRTFSL